LLKYSYDLYLQAVDWITCCIYWFKLSIVKHSKQTKLSSYFNNYLYNWFKIDAILPFSKNYYLKKNAGSSLPTKPWVQRVSKLSGRRSRRVRAAKSSCVGHPPSASPRTSSATGSTTADRTISRMRAIVSFF
jgi:hypothetical protein